MAMRSFVVRIDLNGEPVDMSISEFLAHLARMDDDSMKVKEAIDFVLNLKEELSMIDASEYHFPNCMRFLKDAIATVENEKLKYSERARKNQGKLHEISFDIVRSAPIINDENRNMHEGEAGNVSDESFIENEIPSNVRDGMLLWPEQLVQPETIGSDPNFVREVTRRQRMVWSVDLHRKFRFAVEALGGPKEAKPKQIHDLLKVDGLTTEQIKSHLQRYRKHLNCRGQLGSTLESGQIALTANSTLVRNRFSLLCMQRGESSNDHKIRASNKKMN